MKKRSKPIDEKKLWYVLIKMTRIVHEGLNKLHFNYEDQILFRPFNIMIDLKPDLPLIRLRGDDVYLNI